VDLRLGCVVVVKAFPLCGNKTTDQKVVGSIPAGCTNQNPLNTNNFEALTPEYIKTPPVLGEAQ
jgi:hypothetical protein